VADQAIRENEWRLRRLFDTDLIGMVFWNVHGGITDANAAFLKLVGYTEADLRSRKLNWSKMTPREHRHLDEYALKELRETGVDTPYEKQFIRKDGNRVWVLVGAAMFDETNGVAYVLDISRRRETEDRFRTLADNIPQLAWMADRAGSIFWYNRRWYDYTGTHLHEVMGWDWQKVHHPDYVDQVVQKISHCFQTGEVWEDTFPLRGKDGTYRWFLSRAVPIRDSDGQIIRWFGTNTDVTKQRRLEDALESALDEAQRRAKEAEEGKRLLDAVMEHVPEGITIADVPDVNIRMVSRFGQEMLGKPAELITNIPVDEHAGKWAVFHADGVTLATGEELPLTRATQHGEQVRNEEWVLRSEDGSMVPILCNAGPIRDPSGKITGGIIVWRDISELRQARAKAERHMEGLKAAIAEAEAANRAKDHFLAVVSHELRTPLMPVLGVTSFMLANPALPKAFRKDVEMIRRNVELEAKIIDDLLDVARIAAGKVQLSMERIDVHALIHNVMSICQSEVEGKAIQTDLRLDAVQCYVQGDSTRLQQVLWNVVRNAAKFTPEHGRITVRTSCTDDQLRVEVEDNGRGIDPQMLPKIFDAFEQGGKDTNQRFGGLGLGRARGLLGARLGRSAREQVTTYAVARSMGRERIERIRRLGPGYVPPARGAQRERTLLP
jgi:PAS domain S-box-containing protein